MIPVIIIGRGGSKGFPAKNFTKINGIPIMAYPILAALDSVHVTNGQVYFSTEDRRLKHIAIEYNAKVIDRPVDLATDAALGEDVFIHAYKWIKENNDKYRLEAISKNGVIFRGLNTNKIEFVVLMFANAPCITSQMIDEMVDKLRGDKSEPDSICTVSRYNMFSPSRMRRFDRISGTEMLPYTDHYAYATCDRDSVEDAYIYDCSCAIVRPKCLEKIEEGLPPQRWLGKHILGYKQEDPALDIDYEWQLGQLEWWLGRNWIW